MMYHFILFVLVLTFSIHLIFWGRTKNLYSGATLFILIVITILVCFRVLIFTLQSLAKMDWNILSKLLVEG